MIRVAVVDDQALMRAGFRALLDAVDVVGLAGMRERVTALGGTLRSAPRAEGGFAVRAELPLGEAG